MILSPTQFTILLAGVIGAIAVTGEYSTGMIRSTFTAQPRRGAVLVAKSIVGARGRQCRGLRPRCSVDEPLSGDAPIDWAGPMVSTIPVACGVLEGTSQLYRFFRCTASAC